MDVSRHARFDDVVHDDDGGVECEYHGVNYEIISGDRKFFVRLYDDEPGVGAVISPTNARTCDDARELAEFMCAKLGCRQIQFYSPSIGAYRLVDIRTLDFVDS